MQIHTFKSSQIGFQITLTNVEASLKKRWDNVISTLKQRWKDVPQRLFNVVSTSDTNIVSTLHNVENPKSDFVSFSTSDQLYFNVDLQCWSDVEMLAGILIFVIRCNTTKYHHLREYLFSHCQMCSSHILY